MCAYQGVRNISFFGNLAYLVNERPLYSFPFAHHLFNSKLKNQTPESNYGRYSNVRDVFNSSKIACEEAIREFLKMNFGKFIFQKLEMLLEQHLWQSKYLLQFYVRIEQLIGKNSYKNFLGFFV